MGEVLASPDRPKKLKKAMETKAISPYNPDEALAYILDTKQSKSQYMKTRLGAKQRGADIYPAYRHILEAKKRCYPDGIHVNDHKAEIPLQSLLNHTGKRIIQVQKTVIDEEKSGPKSLHLQYK